MIKMLRLTPPLVGSALADLNLQLA